MMRASVQEEDDNDDVLLVAATIRRCHMFDDDDERCLHRSPPEWRDAKPNTGARLMRITRGAEFEERDT